MSWVGWKESGLVLRDEYDEWFIGRSCPGRSSDY